MRELKIAYGSSCFAKVWSNKKVTFNDLCQRLSTTVRTPETVEEYPRLPKKDRDRAKDKGGFVGGWLKDGRRKGEAVACRSMLTLDGDKVEQGFIERYDREHKHASCLYTTHGNTPEAPRVRIIIPLTRDVTPDEYAALARYVVSELGIDGFDECSYRAHQLMYWPTTPSNGEYVFRRFEGGWCDPDAYFAANPNWRDCSQLPTSSRESKVMARACQHQKDPLEKPGVIGAFCRSYSISDAIDKFLPDVYAPSAMAGRYDYIPADSQAGVVLYDDKFAYSHHASDPACGRLLNAFDIVRVHRFGELDQGVAGDTDPTKLPSFAAMQNFAVQDDCVKDTLAAERMEQATQEFENPDDWQRVLELDKQGRVKDTMSNIVNIIRYDPNLQAIVLNELTGMLDVNGKLPWRQIRPGWGDADLANAKVYFEQVYGLWSPTKFKDGLLAVVSSERHFHPIKEYFETLSWDGIDRVDTLLIDYLGAEDTPYVRAVTRKTLCAAVARIYQPGIKFDTILVLNGPQGIGKSTLFARLGGKWFSDSLTIGDMKDKSAAEKLQGYWILELGELAGIRKVDVETVKSFITRTDDKFRQSYGTTVESHPRNNIIVGSTNSESGFLRDITGNRRFWPVAVAGGSKRSVFSLTQQVLDQIWAEAIELYREGESLILPDDIAAMAYAQQQAAMEADDREGIVIEYLERLLPEEWDTLDLYQRRSYFGENEFGGAQRVGTKRRERVCIMEIWCECFGKERQNLKRSDSFEIEGILNRIGGWRKITSSKTGKTRFPLYGPQKTFVRHSEESTSTC